MPFPAPPGTSVQGSTLSATPFDTFLGYQAGAAETTATSNTFIGYQAGKAATTGGTNTFIGYQAGTAATTAGSCTFVGWQAGQNATTGFGNTCVGGNAGRMGTTFNQSVLIGYAAGNNVTSASNCVAVGYNAGNQLSSGTDDTFIGMDAGYPGQTNATATGSRDTFIGRDAGQNSATQRNDATSLGYQAKVDGDNAIAIGSGVLAGAAGTVAIGKDSAGTSASSTVANEVKLGTALHTVNIIGKTKIAAQARTAGALPTVQLVSTTGAQIDATADRETITAVTFNPSAGASATALVEVSPDNTTYTGVGTWTIPAGVTFDGTIELISVAIPAGWYLRVTTTNAVLGLTTYY